MGPGRPEFGIPQIAENNSAMKKLPAPAVPAYSLSSVDNALKLLQMLRDHGKVRLRVAAKDLGIAESTAHRLLSMLVYRGFAVQDEARAYYPGPALGVAPARVSGIPAFIAAASPYIDMLAIRMGETASLAIRVGTKVHFLWSREGAKLPRILSREGAVLPAISTAMGKVLLAPLSDSDLRMLYQGRSAELHGESISERDLQKLVENLGWNRVNGYATAIEETEMGVRAIAMPLADKEGNVVAAFAIAVPKNRFANLITPKTLEIMRATRAEIEAALVQLDIPAPY